MPAAFVVDRELELLLDCLPQALRAQVVALCGLHPNLVQLELDAGRPPMACFQDGVFKVRSANLTVAEIKEITHLVNDPSRTTGFHEDSRAGINGTLHRSQIFAAHPW